MLARDNPGSPERRAIARIKRKASGMSAAATVDYVALEDTQERPSGGEQGVQPARAAGCRCAEADIKAYRDADEWICQTCGRQLSPHATRRLEERARRVIAGATGMQRLLA
jgi:hypothetical protein